MKIVESIADSLHTDKGRDTALILVVIALSFGSFVLGRISVQGNTHQGVEVASALMATTPQQDQETSTISHTKASASPATNSVAKTTVVAKEKETTTATTVGGKYVASKSGSAYYFPWCGTVKRIKEENKVYFNTKEEAEKAGYHPAGNCKGL